MAKDKAKGRTRYNQTRTGGSCGKAGKNVLWWVPDFSVSSKKEKKYFIYYAI